ncbi:MAG TPA: hypothetical protein PKA98_08220 [Acidimicrobiales bacterium]|nr:hypothetical protein [Acidimicrobiales bacterium]
MDEPTRYRIVIRGDAGARALRPFADDFTVVRVEAGTALDGTVRDAAQLHGLLVHLTSLNAEVVSVNPVPNTHQTDRSTSP